MFRVIVGLVIGLLGFAPSAGSREQVEWHPCTGSFVGVSRASDGTLIHTTRDYQKRIYVLTLKRSCIEKGTVDNYRWPGYKLPK